VVVVVVVVVVVGVCVCFSHRQSDRQLHLDHRTH
jgi:hypothetical protein